MLVYQRVRNLRDICCNFSLPANKTTCPRRVPTHTLLGFNSLKAQTASDRGGHIILSCWALGLAPMTKPMLSSMRGQCTVFDQPQLCLWDKSLRISAAALSRMALRPANFGHQTKLGLVQSAHMDPRCDFKGHDTSCALALEEQIQRSLDFCVEMDWIGWTLAQNSESAPIWVPYQRLKWLTFIIISHDFPCMYPIVLSQGMMSFQERSEGHLLLHADVARVREAAAPPADIARRNLQGDFTTVTSCPLEVAG